MSFTWEHDQAVRSITDAVTEALSGHDLSEIKTACASFSHPDSESEYFWARGLIGEVVVRRRSWRRDHDAGRLLLDP